jgi:hypothetical protein
MRQLKEAGATEDKAAAAAGAVQAVGEDVSRRIEDRLIRMEDRLRGLEERLTRIETDIWWVRWIITGGVGLYVLRSIAEWIR